MSHSNHVLDIAQVTERTGLPASTLRHWESQGLIRPVGRRGLRRQYDDAALESIAYIRLGQAAGFSLTEIATWMRSEDSPELDRAVLRAKADEVDATIRRLEAVRDGLRHAADCPASSHAACPTFRALLGDALGGAFEPRRVMPR
ncbi:MAG: helix-turn-helix domain-containing protein [Acidobacteriota bacterium]